MKKIINGKLYDTATAEDICSNGFSDGGDFRYWCDTLYRTKKGNFFMYGEGGAMSKYSESLGNNTTGGSSHMWAVSNEEARDFVSENDVNKAVKIFGDFEEA